MNIRSVAAATLVAGTLDIGSAMLMTFAHGRPVEKMLQGIATGPFGEGVRALGPAGAAVGLLVHYCIMAAMVTAFALAADRLPWLRRRPLVAGPAYGLLLYLVMYWVVIPLRWGAATMTFEIGRTLTPIAIHIMLVGIPIAFIIARGQAERVGSAADPVSRGA